jgi:organic radical activating enzyme
MIDKMVEYQMFTKCNLKCPYCYNYFDENVDSLKVHIADLEKISVLVDKNTRLVINGGEPFLFKGLAQLINSMSSKTHVLTYTNGTLPKRVYEKFVSTVNKDNLFLTSSIHYAELLRTNNMTPAYKESVKYLIQNIPNFKITVVFTEDFASKEFTEAVTELLKEFKEAGLKYINVLLQDSLKKDPARAVKLTNTEHFKKFFKDLKMFEYRHCMWNNTNVDVSCLQMWLRKEVMGQPRQFKMLSFLKYKGEFIIESNFDIKSDHFDGERALNINGLIEDLKTQL